MIPKQWSLYRTKNKILIYFGKRILYPLAFFIIFSFVNLNLIAQNFEWVTPYIQNNPNSIQDFCVSQNHILQLLSFRDTIFFKNKQIICPIGKSCRAIVMSNDTIYRWAKILSDNNFIATDGLFQNNNVLIFGKLTADINVFGKLFQIKNGQNVVFKLNNLGNYMDFRQFQNINTATYVDHNSNIHVVLKGNDSVVFGGIKIKKKNRIINAKFILDSNFKFMDTLVQSTSSTDFLNTWYIKSSNQNQLILSNVGVRNKIYKYDFRYKQSNSVVLYNFDSNANYQNSEVLGSNSNFIPYTMDFVKDRYIFSTLLTNPPNSFIYKNKKYKSLGNSPNSIISLGNLNDTSERHIIQVYSIHKNALYAASYVRSVIVDSAKNYYIGGDFTGILDINKNKIKIPKDSFSNTDIFLCKLDSNLSVLYFLRIGGTGQEALGKLILGLDNSVYLSGFFNRKLTLGKFNIKSLNSNSPSSFLAKIADLSITIKNTNKTSFCAGDSIKVHYTKTGKYDSSNKFVLQFSDTNGFFVDSLTSYTSIDSVTSKDSGVIKGLIPINMPSSNRYKIRIVSTNPTVFSYQYPVTFEVANRPTAKIISIDSICLGQKLSLNTSKSFKYNWHAQSISDSTIQNPIIYPRNNIRISLKLYSNKSCYDTISKNIFLKPIINLRIKPDTNKLCYGASTYIIATYNKVNSPKIIWSTGDTNSKISVNPLVTTIYSCIASDGCNKNDTQFVKITVLPRVRLNKINDTIVCINSKPQITPTTKDGQSYLYNFKWFDGDTNRIKSISPVINTSYYVTAKNSCSPIIDTQFFTINVAQNPKLTLNIMSAKLCFGKSIIFKTTQLNPTLYKYKLAWQNNQFDTQKSFIYTNVKSGFDTVSLLFKNQYCPPDTLKSTIRNFSKIKLSVISTDSNLCQGQYIDLKASAKGGDSVNYKYAWSDGSSNNYLKVSPKVNTNYSVTIKDGCQDSVQGIIKIKVLDNLKLKISGTDTACYGVLNKISFSSKGGKGSYLYSIGGGSYKKDSTITIKCFNDTLIRVSAWDGCSTPAIDSFKIYVVQPPKINVTLMPNKGCEPLLLSAIDSTVSNNYKNSVLRIGSNEYDLPYFSNPIKDTFKAGSYPVNYTIYINNCVFSQKLSDLIVYPKPSPKILPDSFYEVLKDEYKSVALTGINQSNYVNKYMDSFLWSVNQIGYSQNKSIYFPRKDSGLFNVQLKIKSPFGCLDSANARIIIHPQLSVYIPNAITPNQDGLNDGFYPQGMGIKSFKIKLYSRWGQLIFDGKENEKWIPLASETSINVLVYVIDFVDFNGEHKMETGNVSVVR